MAPQKSLEILLRLDAAQLRAGLGQAASDIRGFDAEVNRISTSGQRGFGLVSDAVAGLGNVARTVFSDVVHVGATAFEGLSVAGTGFIATSTLVAARVQEMNGVLENLARVTGVSYDAMQQQVAGVRAQGIEAGVAQELVASLARQNLNLAQATQLARVAQDAAVFSGRNSTDVLADILHGIQTQNSLVLRNAGLTTEAGQAMDAYAKSIGKSSTELTAAERQQAVLNAVLQEGTTIAGSYAAAMEQPGKQLRSIPRLINDIQVNVGQAFLPAFGQIIHTGYETAKSLGAITVEGQPLAVALGRVGQSVSNLLTPMTRFVGEIPTRLPALIGPLTSLQHQLAGLEPVIAGVGAAMSTMALRNIPLLGQFVPAFSPITGALAGLLLSTKEGRDAVGHLGSSLLDVAHVAGPPIVAALSELVRLLSQALAGVLDRLGPALVDVARTLGPVLGDAIRQLAPLVSDVVTQFGRLAAEILPRVAQVAADVAPIVVYLVGSGLQLLANVLSVIADHANIAVPALAALGAALATSRIASWVDDVTAAGTALGKLLDVVKLIGGAFATGGISGGIAAIREQLAALPQGITSIGIAVAGAAAAFAEWSNMMREAKQQGDDFVSKIRSQIDIAGGSYTYLTDKLGKVRAGMNDLRTSADNSIAPWDTDYRAALRSGADGLDTLGNSIQDLLARADALAAKTGINKDAALDLVRAQDQLKGKFDATSSAADLLGQALDKLAGKNLNADQAAIRYNDSLAQLQSTFTDVRDGQLGVNDALDASTEIGRTHLQQVIDSTQAAKDYALALVKQSGDVGGARMVLQNYADTLRAQLDPLGKNTAAVDQLLSRYGLMPDQIETTIKQVGGEAVAAQVTALQGQLDQLGGAKAHPEIQALIDNKSFTDAQAAIDKLNGKKITPDVDGSRVLAELDYITKKLFPQYQAEHPTASLYVDGNPAKSVLDWLMGKYFKEYAASNPTTPAYLDANPASGFIDWLLHTKFAEYSASNPTTTANVNTDPAAASINAFIQANQGRSFTFYANLKVNGVPYYLASNQSVGLPGPRWGGVVTPMAWGGTTTPAHIARTQLFRYGEPETGGEAFIPRLGDRNRSLEILKTAAGWLGADVVDTRQRRFATAAVPPQPRLPNRAVRDGAQGGSGVVLNVNSPLAHVDVRADASVDSGKFEIAVRRAVEPAIEKAIDGLTRELAVH